MVIMLTSAGSAGAAVVSGVAVSDITSDTQHEYDGEFGDYWLTTIGYTLSGTDNNEVYATISNGAGPVARLYGSTQDRGRHSLYWDGWDDSWHDVAPGNYAVTITAKHSYNYTGQWGSEGLAAGKLYGPEGIAVNKATKDVYVVDARNHRVQVFDANGQFKKQWGTFGWSGPGQFGYPEYVAINSTGYVYVTDGRGAQIFDKDGTYVSQFQNTTYYSVYGIAVNSSDYVYVAANTQNIHYVDIYTPNGTFVSRFSSSAGPTTFGYIRGLGINSTGDVFVLDSGSGGVRVFDRSGSYLYAHSDPNVFLWQDILFAPDDTAYAICLTPAGVTINAFDRNWNLLNSRGTSGTGNGEFAQAWHLALNDTGYLYVTDLWLDRVQIFSPAGAYAGQWGASNTGPGMLRSPVAMTLDSAGNIYVVDDGYTGNGTRIYDNQGNYLRTIASGQSRVRAVATNSTGYQYTIGNYQVVVTDRDGNAVNSFDYTHGVAGTHDPAAMAVNSTGYVYVLDAGSDSVRVFGAGGQFIREWGSQGSGPGQFSYPVGLAINATGYVYVSDYSSRQIQVFDPDGKFAYSFWPRLMGIDGRSSWYPTYIAISPQFVFVWDGRYIRMFDYAGNYVTSFSRDAPGALYQRQIGSLAADQSGQVFLLDMDSRYVNEFTYAPSSTTASLTFDYRKPPTFRPPATIDMSQFYAHGSVVHTSTPTPIGVPTAAPTATPPAAPTVTPVPSPTVAPLTTPTTAPTPAPTQPENNGAFGGPVVLILAIVALLGVVAAGLFVILRRK